MCCWVEKKKFHRRLPLCFLRNSSSFLFLLTLISFALWAEKSALNSNAATSLRDEFCRNQSHQNGREKCQNLIKWKIVLKRERKGKNVDVCGAVRPDMLSIWLRIIVVSLRCTDGEHRMASGIGSVRPHTAYKKSICRDHKEQSSLNQKSCHEAQEWWECWGMRI